MYRCKYPARSKKNMFICWIRRKLKYAFTLDCFASHIVWCHNVQSLSNICNSTEFSERSHSCASEPCSVPNLLFYQLFKFYRVLMKPFHSYFKWQECLFHVLSLFTVSSTSLLVLLWSTEGCRRQMTSRKERQTWCSLDCILHFSFFRENVIVNRNCFNLQIQWKPFELLITISDVNLSVCSSSTDRLFCSYF